MAITEFTKKMCPIWRDCGTGDVEDWKRVDRSTVWEIAFNPNTEDKEYITDDTPTTQLKNYKPSMPQELETTKESGGIYDIMSKRAIELPVGEKAYAKYIIALPDVNEAGKIYAWRVDTTEIFDNLNMVDKKIKWGINVRGNIEVGTVVPTDGKPVFTVGDGNVSGGII